MILSGIFILGDEAGDLVQLGRVESYAAGFVAAVLLHEFLEPFESSS